MSKEAKWNIAQAADSGKAAALALALGIDRVLAELLVQRGIESFDQARHSSGQASIISTTLSYERYGCGSGEAS